MLRASTGPRSRERGILHTEKYHWLLLKASTGPRSRERGIASYQRAGKSVFGASTGPRSRERGILITCTGAGSFLETLQRGRAHVSAEFTNDLYIGADTRSLQR